MWLSELAIQYLERYRVLYQPLVDAEIEIYSDEDQNEIKKGRLHRLMYVRANTRLSALTYWIVQTDEGKALVGNRRDLYQVLVHPGAIRSIAHVLRRKNNDEELLLEAKRAYDEESSTVSESALRYLQNQLDVLALLTYPEELSFYVKGGSKIEGFAHFDLKGLGQLHLATSDGAWYIVGMQAGKFAVGDKPIANVYRRAIYAKANDAE